MPTICGWFERAGFERRWLSDPGDRFGVGVHRRTVFLGGGGFDGGLSDPNALHFSPGMSQAGYAGLSTRKVAEDYRPFDYGRFEFRFDRESGTLNFLDEAKRREGAALVRRVSVPVTGTCSVWPLSPASSGSLATQAS